MKTKSFLRILVLSICIISPGCIKDDYRDKYTGPWGFEVNHSRNSTGQPGKTSNNRSYNQGIILKGSGSDGLIIKYKPETVIEITVAKDGSIGNLPGDKHWGNFEGSSSVHFGYGHWGNYVDFTSVQGEKGSYSINAPAVSSDSSKVLTYGALLYGTVNPGMSRTSVYFDYGKTEEYGFSDSVGIVLNGFKSAGVNDDVPGLEPNTLYHFRVRAVNSQGVSYGKDMTFKTHALTEPATDADGNVYPTVKIDDNIWMGENLKVTKLNNGNTIDFLPDNNLWTTANSPAFCYYDNDPANKNIYGALYNQHAVSTNMLCPTGWRVPTDEEWSSFIAYLDYSGNAGGNLKEAGTAHWLAPNEGANNITGFTALPGGGRRMDGLNPGTFSGKGLVGYFWSSNSSAGYGRARHLWYNIRGADKGGYPDKSGFSVRCIKN